MGDHPPPWGLTPLLQNQNRRQIPEWMDPKGEHGDVKFLVLKPILPAKLPTYPFVISKSIEQAVGQINGGQPIENGNAYLLKVRADRQVEKLLLLKELIDSTPVSITFHQSLNTCKCVVTCKEVEGASNEQLVNDLSNQGVIGVYRFQRKSNGHDVPTHTMVLTIQGTVVPRYIRFGFIQVSTRPYYSRPMLCHRCGKFGHTQKHCKQTPICLTCGDPEVHTNCQKEPHCLNCQNLHPTNSRDCPVFKDEQEIIKIRTDRGISRNEAIMELRNRQKAANSVQQRLTQARSENLIDNKEQEILKLRKQVALLTAQVAMFTRRANREDENINDTSPEDSESDTSMDTIESKTTQASTPKRTRNPSSEDSPTHSNPSLKTSKKNRPRKKRHRKPETALSLEGNHTADSQHIPPYQTR